MDSLFRHQLNIEQKGVLVERKAFLSAKNIELQFYETLTPAEQVKLKFSLPVIAVMLKGDKIVEMEDLGRFTYSPGESLIVPADTELKIDFPTASPDNPTQCLAFVPDPQLIEEASYEYCQQTKESDLDLSDEVNFKSDLLMRDQAILNAIDYLLFLFSERNENSDLFIGMKTKELVIRILQSKARRAFLQTFERSHNRMSHIARYIRNNIGQAISIQKLSEEAHMSKSNFYVLFKNTFGITPNEYVIQMKIEKAKELIQRTSRKSMAQIAYELGYTDSSYFAKQFKQMTGYTPRQYEKMTKVG